MQSWELALTRRVSESVGFPAEAAMFSRGLLYRKTRGRHLGHTWGGTREGTRGIYLGAVLYKEPRPSRPPMLSLSCPPRVLPRVFPRPWVVPGAALPYVFLAKKLQLWKAKLPRGSPTARNGCFLNWKTKVLRIASFAAPVFAQGARHVPARMTKNMPAFLLETCHLQTKGLPRASPQSPRIVRRSMAGTCPIKSVAFLVGKAWF